MFSSNNLLYHLTIHILFQFVVALLASAAAALPIEDAPEVAAAKAEFNAAFEDAAAGGLTAKQAAQIATAYLADTEDVAAAKAAFTAAFDDAAAGGLAAKQEPAPVHAVAAPAPVAINNGYYGLPYNGYYNPYYAFNGLTGYAGYGYGYNNGYFGYNTLAYHPYAYPTLVHPAAAVVAPAAEMEAADEE